ncbi:MAG: hypothetical protein ACRD2U_08475 [Terriglobales bacterium]
MKRAGLFLCAVILLTVTTSLSSFAADALLCSGGATAGIAGNSTWETVYTCTIPANDIPAFGAIRVTATVSFPQISAQANTQIAMNGVNIIGSGSGGSDNLHYNQYEVLILNNSSTTGELTGFVPSNGSPVGVNTTWVHLSNLAWSSAQTVSIVFESNSSNTIAQGLSFTVEEVK